MKQLKSFLLLLIFFSHCGHGNESHDRGDPTKSNRVTPIVLAVSKVLESVVNVSTERIVTQRYQRFGYTDPFTDFFNRFFGFQHKDYATSSLGINSPEQK
jgi:S1-C subfamily serine protease